ncbi:685_t:CDS:2 [Funneliformis caledonium]|uniref:685_t:CDS:1 n=1 Tax=Funneliformis caledonium TaxID=1117310 RepID=A0A9N8UXZ2_9GLOM|nr:685_t:CDS:2 [Funneliformis caledonium]
MSFNEYICNINKNNSIWMLNNDHHIIEVLNAGTTKTMTLYEEMKENQQNHKSCDQACLTSVIRGETIFTTIEDNQRKINLRIVYKRDDTELSHTECAKSPTLGKAIRDKSKCLRTLKYILDEYLRKDLSENDVKTQKYWIFNFLLRLHGQIIGVELLDNELYFGLEGSSFSLSA